MPRATGYRSLASKEAIWNESYDLCIEIFGDVKVKIEKVNLLDLDLVDQVLFPQMNIDVLWDMTAYAIGGMHFVPNPKFINLFNSTIMNLRDLLVFETTGEVVRYTKFLISWVHDRSIWLD
jgi:hypothetical protein